MQEQLPISNDTTEPTLLKKERKSHSAFQGWHDYFRPYLDAFARYGVLSQSMLCAVTGHAPSTARTALHALTQIGYVQHQRTLGQVLYYLTFQGMNLTEYKPYARSPQAAFGIVQHDTAVNALMTNTILHGCPPGYGLVQWLGPSESKEELAMFYGYEETERSKQLNYMPDSYFQYLMQLENDKCALYPVVLEVDLGTETQAHVLKKIETGVRALAQRANGSRYNLLWIFVDGQSRCQNVMNEARNLLKELRTSIPAIRFPQVLAKSMSWTDIRILPLPTKALLMETGDETTWTGYATEARELTNFVGVSRVRDRIKNELQLRTQIPALLRKDGE